MAYVKQEIIGQKTVITKGLLDYMQDGIINADAASANAVSTAQRAVDEAAAAVEIVAQASAAPIAAATRLLEAAAEQRSALAGADGHLWQIAPDVDHEVALYKVVDGEITESGTVPGSDFILCPKNLCIDFVDSTSRCWLYFFDLVDGAFVPRWDIVNQTTSSGVKNYIQPAMITSRMLEIPDGVFMKVAPATSGDIGAVNFYGWDGEMFGMPVSADAGFRAKDGTEGALKEDGSSGLTLPGSTRFVCCGDAALLAIYGCKDGTFTALDVDDSRRFKAMPEGYDFFRMRLYYGKAAPYEMLTRSGDVSDRVSIAVDSVAEVSAARARKVLDACRKVVGIEWTAQAELPESSKGTFTYKPGVTYTGIPYSSAWAQTHFVGWHVTPHTFANAAADPDSVFYKEAADNGEVTAPYYGLVCSSFATLCDGWPYPQTNAGFVYDPMVQIAWSAMPPLGAVYSNLASHCFIPERIDRMSDADAVSMFEAVRPVTGRSTRYSNINSAHDQGKFNASCLDGYADDYGFTARHLQATTFADAPYANFDNVRILVASALPYHGDRCIHTSDDAAVLINIKNAAATALVLTLPDDTAQAIAIPSGAAQVDVKPYLLQDGIYYVHTDADDVQASFEYHAIEPVACTVQGGVVTFDRNDWWYTFALMGGSPYFTEEKACTIQARADGDYSAWSQGGHYVSDVYCVFYKGTYGAYPVPCTVSIT